MKKHGWILNVQYQVKEASLIYYFKYKTFWKKQIYNNGEKTSDWEDFKDGQRVD